MVCTAASCVGEREREVKYFFVIFKSRMRKGVVMVCDGCLISYLKGDSGGRR